jgi:uncharacterized DUF497 family protein
MTFEWDEQKNQDNIEKDHISFEVAQEAFFDANRVIRKDKKHSKAEDRFFCIGKVAGGIVTVRYTKRNGKIRILGAGYWREGRYFYEERNHVR